MTRRAVRALDSRSNVLVDLLVWSIVCEVCIMGSANVQAANGPVEQALIITIPLTNGKSGSQDEVQRLFKLEDELTKATEQSRVGEYDGNEIGAGTFTMYAYGPSANKLFDVALPILVKYKLPLGSRAVKRYGKPGAKEERIPLGNGTAN